MRGNRSKFHFRTPTTIVIKPRTRNFQMGSVPPIAQDKGGEAAGAESRTIIR